MFFCEKASEAAPNTATSFGAGGQRRLEALQVRRQHRIAHAGRRWQAAPSPRRCRPSAAPTSARRRRWPRWSRRPASARRSISSSLVAVGTTCFSFCRPSRGPTSTMRTFGGSGMRHGRLTSKSDQLGAVADLLADGVAEGLDRAAPRRADGVLHLHRFQDQQRRALVDAARRPRRSARSPCPASAPSARRSAPSPSPAGGAADRPAPAARSAAVEERRAGVSPATTTVGVDATLAESAHAAGRSRAAAPRADDRAWPSSSSCDGRRRRHAPITASAAPRRGAA